MKTRKKLQEQIEVLAKEKLDLHIEVAQLRKDCRQGCENGERLKQVIEGMRRRGQDARELALVMPKGSPDQLVCDANSVVWKRAAALVEYIAVMNNMLPPEVAK